MDTQETTARYGYEPPANGSKPLIEVSNHVWKIIDEKMPELRNLAYFSTWRTEMSPDAILLGTEEFNDYDLKFRPRLRCISRIGTGIDNIRLPKEDIERLVVTEKVFTPEAVVEYDIKLFHRWLYGQKDKSIREVTAGIIGTGAIGSLLEKRLAKIGVGRVISTDILRPNPMGIDVKKNADILFVHIPSTLENRHFIDRKFLQDSNCDTIIAPVRTNVIDFHGIRNFAVGMAFNLIVDCELPDDRSGLGFVESTHHTATRVSYWYERMVRAAALNAIHHLSNTEGK